MQPADRSTLMADVAQTAEKTAEAGRKAWKDGATQAAAATTAGAAAFKDATEKSLGALNDLNAQGKRNLEAVVASVTAATRGAEALGAQAIAFSKSSLEGQVEAVRQISSARSLQEVLELQTAYAKSAMEGYIAELSRASETFSATVKDSLKPLNERASAVIESVQAAR
jgi:phasin family protein